MTDKVAFPRLFVDHWLNKPLKWEAPVEVPCDYCPEPIQKGDSYFVIGMTGFILGVPQNPEKRGHLRHLEYAEPAVFEDTDEAVCECGGELWVRRETGQYICKSCRRMTREDEVKKVEKWK